MARRTHLDAPFVGGMVTDSPAYRIDKNQTTVAQDMVAPQGVATMRRGWAYHGGTGVASIPLSGVWRAKFSLNGNTRTITTGQSNGKLYLHNASGAATDLGTIDSNAEFLPRCMYRDEVILCAQDGTTPFRRYGGAGVVGDQILTTDWSATQFEASAERTTGSTALDPVPEPGMFFYLVPGTVVNENGIPGIRIIEGGATEVVLEDAYLVGATRVLSSVTTAPFAVSIPCASIYEAGSLTISSSVATGYGTKWDDSYSHYDVDAVIGGGDCLLVLETGAEHALRRIDDPPSNNTTLPQVNGPADVAVKSPYKILRSPPWKDAANHKGSLWGTGNAVYPNRVYVSPPDWNPAVPPGATVPFDYSTGYTSADANDFLLDFIDVPGPYDGDENIALLSSPGPLLVLKRRAVHGVFGAYPDFSQELVDDNAGCIDIRSAFSNEAGQFWAGENGIFAFYGGRVWNLTSGRINREWRALTRGFDFGTNDYCSMGEVYGHLVVHITTDGGTTQRTYVGEFNREQPWETRWMSRFTNHNARAFFSQKVPGETESLLFVSDDNQGDVMDAATAINLSGTVADADSTNPSFSATTGSLLKDTGTIDGESRMFDLHISHNVYDTATSSTELDVDVAAWSGLRSPTAGITTIAMENLAGTTNDQVELYQTRPALSGRQHQLTVGLNTLDSDNSKLEIHEVSVSFEDARTGS